jgi:hypothetical protein
MFLAVVIPALIAMALSRLWQISNPAHFGGSWLVPSAPSRFQSIARNASAVIRVFRVIRLKPTVMGIDVLHCRRDLLRPIRNDFSAGATTFWACEGLAQIPALSSRGGYKKTYRWHPKETRCAGRAADRRRLQVQNDASGLE